MEKDDLVTITDGSKAVRVDAYEKDTSIGLCRDLFKIIGVVFNNYLVHEDNHYQMHDIFIRNTENGRIYLHTMKFVRLAKPKATNHEMHKSVWGDLGETGGEKKAVVVEKLALPKVLHDCFACEEAFVRTLGLNRNKRRDEDDNGERCLKCPIDWSLQGDKPAVFSCEYANNSPWKAWKKTTGEGKKVLATLISNMKWKEQ